jgi:pimeloyl-ACP methyl ester carboxylesterase
VSASRAITVLVHGLWTHGIFMDFQRRELKGLGFAPVCYSYHSVRVTLSENADRLAEYARTLAAPRLHWVGHSLGGIVILHMLHRNKTLPPGRVVLQGPPYRDSYSGRSLARSGWGSRLLGGSMGEWLETA